MPVIARQGSQPYLRPMASAVLKLVAFLAVLLMPLGIATAPAAAEPHSATAASGHCDEHQKPAEAPAEPQAHCTGCSALPAMEAPAAAGEARPQAPMLLALSDFRAGVEPDTITPPPKLS